MCTTQPLVRRHVGRCWSFFFWLGIWTGPPLMPGCHARPATWKGRPSMCGAASFTLQAHARYPDVTRMPHKLQHTRQFKHLHCGASSGFCLGCRVHGHFRSLTSDLVCSIFKVSLQFLTAGLVGSNTLAWLSASTSSQTVWPKAKARPYWEFLTSRKPRLPCQGVEGLTTHPRS